MTDDFSLCAEDVPPLVRGHGLRGEGAPHNSRGVRLTGQGVWGRGRAKCSCGVLSPDLPSAAARKRWHWNHKRAVVAALLRSPAP